jgi:peptidoglycan/xylan/chitin deacetylase (PgdA/CDA1 family)
VAPAQVSPAHTKDMRKVVVAARLAVTAVLVAGLAACGSGASAPSTAPTAARASAAHVPTPVPTAGSRTAGPQGASPSAPQATHPLPPSPGPVPSAAPPVTGWLAGTDWTYIPTTRHVVALTFDAGANADAVAPILATLRRDHVAATFFLTGNFARTFPAAARAIAAAGYRIGDHTITHPHLTQLSDAAVRREILGGARQITAVTGVSPAPLFRFPYGDVSGRTIAIANRAGYVPVRWTVDTLGWEGTAGHISAAVVTARVLAALRPGEIVLMHVGSNPSDHSTFDAGALPHVIRDLRARGYSFVTLDALVG